ncbi:MAG: GNAT family N-acetyltransferase [Pyrinomonadaceae bacterium]
MSYSIRKADFGDVSQLEKLLDDYLRETYNSVWAGTAERLKSDGFGREFEMLIAKNTSQEIVGFIAWNSGYDLHHCLKGGTVIDFYVAPKNRGHGAGLLLAIEAAAEIEKSGGAFLHGGAVENDSVRRFYNRIAISFPNGECYISGRAFRHLASLAGKSVREIIKNLPESDWNYQP